MRFLLDDTAQRVYAVACDGILNARDVDTYDFHVAIVEFTRGAVVTIENAWILPRSQPMVYDLKLELLGSEGAIYANPSHLGALEIHAGGQMRYGDVLGITPTSDLRTGGFVLEAIARFVDALLYDRPVLATGEDGLEAVRIVSAIEESARLGRPVEIQR